MDTASNFGRNIFHMLTTANMATVKTFDDVSNKYNTLEGKSNVVPVLN
jgi:hypothetical protein